MYECLVPPHCSYPRECKFARRNNESPFSYSSKIVNVYPNDPKAKAGPSSRCDIGFMKKFTVSDDLVITPMNSCSNIGLLKKMKIDLSDLEEHQISISRAEVCF